MKIKSSLLSLLCFVSFPALAAADHNPAEHGHGHQHNHSAGQPSSAVYTARGQVQSTDLEKQRVRITHQAIPALGWPEMTMYFSVDSPDLLEGLKPGQEIRFDFQNVGDGSVILDIESAD